MNTPIYDFITSYINKKTSRFHMPGHKGVPGFLGVEMRDITEIDGADELYPAKGIIAESEQNAGRIFGAHTFYSTEGSSLAIRAALALLVKWSKRVNPDKTPLILAGRNAHKTLINASVTLDFDIDWIMPMESDAYESCRLSGDELDEILSAYAPSDLPVALYVTSPDYLGNLLDIEALAKVCHCYGLLFFVDNAHGAYQKFLKPSLHPMDLGADMCADSAHKTLPVLTGGAYLHISHNTDSFFRENAKKCLALFGSTSPSYLILQSLDLANCELAKTDLSKIAGMVNDLKETLASKGYTLVGKEALKLTIQLPDGNGKYFADNLYSAQIIPEYYDDEHIVFMISSHTTDAELERLRDFLIKNAPSKTTTFPTAVTSLRVPAPKKSMSAKEAFFAPSETVTPKEAVGRIMSGALLSCPPAVPLFMSGEIIDERILKYRTVYSDRGISVVKNN